MQYNFNLATNCHRLERKNFLILPLTSCSSRNQKNFLILPLTGCSSRNKKLTNLATDWLQQ